MPGREYSPRRGWSLGMNTVDCFAFLTQVFRHRGQRIRLTVGGSPGSFPQAFPRLCFRITKQISLPKSISVSCIATVVELSNEPPHCRAKYRTDDEEPHERAGRQQDGDEVGHGVNHSRYQVGLSNLFFCGLIAAMTPTQYLSRIGSAGGTKAAKRLGKKGLRARAKRGWATRNANRKRGGR